MCVCIDGRLKDVLFSGVGELVLSPAVVGLLDARVSPQRLYRADVRLVKRGDLLHLHLAYQLGVILFSKKTSRSTSPLIFSNIHEAQKMAFYTPDSNGTDWKLRNNVCVTSKGVQRDGRLVASECSASCTHLVLLILEGDFKGFGRADHGLH